MVNLRDRIFHLLCSTFRRQSERSEPQGTQREVAKPDAAYFLAEVTAAER